MLSTAKLAHALPRHTFKSQHVLMHCPAVPSKTNIFRALPRRVCKSQFVMPCSSVLFKANTFSCLALPAPMKFPPPTRRSGGEAPTNPEKGRSSPLISTVQGVDCCSMGGPPPDCFGPGSGLLQPATAAHQIANGVGCCSPEGRGGGGVPKKHPEPMDGRNCQPLFEKC